MTSSSRMDPPGWITAAIPDSATASMPSLNGKNASDACYRLADLEAVSWAQGDVSVGRKIHVQVCARAAVPRHHVIQGTVQVR